MKKETFTISCIITPTLAPPPRGREIIKGFPDGNQLTKESLTSARPASRLARFSWGQLDGYMYGASIHGPFDREAATGKKPQHRRVRREHLCFKTGDSRLAGDRYQVFEQAPTDAETLVGVIDEERHLRTLSDP
jgi:hypothetical protein